MIVSLETLSRALFYKDQWRSSKRTAEIVEFDLLIMNCSKNIVYRVFYVDKRFYVVKTRKKMYTNEDSGDFFVGDSKMVMDFVSKR